MSKSNIKLSSPWVSYYHAVKALFDEDKDIKITFDNDTMELKLYVTGEKKMEALTKLFPTEKTFGNVALKISIIPANLGYVSNPGKVFEDAFENNPAVVSTIVIPGAYGNPVTYVVFDKRVVQYWNDNMGDPHGNRSTLFEELAREVFEDSPVAKACLFCTNI